MPWHVRYLQHDFGTDGRGHAVACPYTFMLMEYISRLYDFLDELGRHNDRPWFQAHKDTYDELRAAWLADIDRMISLMAAWDARLAGCEGRKAMYRIYRDTRFSLDKTPYKTHLRQRCRRRVSETRAPAITYSSGRASRSTRGFMEAYGVRRCPN